MDNQEKNTQKHGFEFSGERQSEGYQGKSTQSNESGNAYGFESTSTSEDETKVKNETTTKRTFQTSLPNSGGILAMGIISIASFCCCWGLIGVVLGIIAIIMSSRAEKAYRLDSELYTEASYKNMQAGRVTAIIGLSLAIIWLVVRILILSSFLDVIDIEETIKEINHTIISPGY
jgi:hypothetical protein